MSWSEYDWSTIDWGEGGLAATMADRILMFTRGPNFTAYVGTTTVRTENLLECAYLITVAFGLDDAVGVQLDKLGAILQRTRTPGQTDARYRTLLQIQVELILASVATTQTILDVVRLFTDMEAPEYAEAYPAHFGVGAVLSTTADTTDLVQLLRKAKAGGVAGDLHVSAVGALITSYTPEDPVWVAVDGDAPDGLVFAPSMLSLVDAVSGVAGAPTAGVTYDAFNDARVFDGAAGTEVLHASPIDLTGSAFSVALWVNPDALGGSDVLWSVEGAGGSSIELRLVGAGTLSLVHYFSGADTERVTVEAIAAGAWSHVAFTKDATDLGAGITITINGVPSTYSTTTNGGGTAEDPTGDWRLGNRADGARPLDGSIRRPLVFDRVLTPAEVWNLAHKFPTDYTPADPVTGAGTTSYQVPL